ncbi:MAG: uroporphyrinogen decarboxylase family protein [Candidatus Firestonebacteria bacterium]
MIDRAVKKEKMTRRERVLAAINHKEPDRIPRDLGGMDSTGIHGVAYNKLKKYLGIEDGKTLVYDPYQQVVKVELSVQEKIKGDVLPVIIEPKEWKTGILSDGSVCEIPKKWNEKILPEGKRIALNDKGEEIAVMPSGSYYYDSINPPFYNVETLADLDKNFNAFKGMDWPFFADETFEDIERRAKSLYEKTDFALMGNFCAHIFAGGQGLRGYEKFMEDLYVNPELAEAVMDRLAETYIKRFEKYKDTVGKYVQIINVNDDLGTQEALQISPLMYREKVKPYQKKLYQYIKKNWKGKLFFHSCGSVVDIIPDLIEIGIDILNPVQYAARGMEVKELKKNFGKDLVFWGGGCDTQKVLPFSTSEKIREEVKKQSDILGAGGGYVFCQVHNIQYDIKPENIMALYT